MMMNTLKDSNDYNDNSSISSNAIRRQNDEIPDVIYIRTNTPQSCLDDDDKVEQQQFWLEEDFDEWSTSSSYLSDDWSDDDFSVGTDRTPDFAPSLTNQDSFKLMAKGILFMLLAGTWGGTLLASPESSSTTTKAPLVLDRSVAIIDLGLNLPPHQHGKTGIQSAFNGSLHHQRSVLLHDQ